MLEASPHEKGYLHGEQVQCKGRFNTSGQSNAAIIGLRLALDAYNIFSRVGKDGGRMNSTN